ncbi:MAG: adenylate/guanylate cyclase domain-containing protein [Candidatus Eremiobacterota bacterium]
MPEQPLRNPYVCGHPVSGPEFFGRDDELSRIFTQLARGGHYCVIGSPKVGKTSLLLHMASEGVAERYGLSREALVAYGSLKSLPAATTMGQALARSLRDALQKRVERGGGGSSPLHGVLESLEQYDPSGTLRRSVESAGKVAGKALSAVFKNVKEQLMPTTAPDPDGLVELTRAIAQLRAKELRPVLLVDDAEGLFRSAGPLAEHLAALRRMFDESGCAFVLAMSRRFADVLAEEPPLEALRLRLGALEASEARNAVVEPARAVGVEIPPEWVEQILEFAGTHPLIVQSYCFHLFAPLREARQPDRMRLESEVVDAVRAHLEEQLESLGEAENRRLTERVAGSSSPDSEADARLRQEGILSPEGRLTGVYRQLVRPEAAPTPTPAVPAARPEPGERTLLEVIEERIRLDTYLRERFTQVGTFVDIDVAGSTQLKLGEDDYNVIYSFEEFHRFQREVIEGNGGRILNAIGDETMSLFQEPEEAVRCLCKLLAALPEFNRTRNRLKNPFQIRAGMHLGELIRDVKEERAYSRVLDVAGHLQKLAEDGSVVVSQQVFEALGQPAFLVPFKYAERDGIMSFRLEPEAVP